MKIAIGCDHIGYHMKLHIIEYLKKREYELVDIGTNSEERTDYPIYGERVARLVADGTCRFGILICGTGVGISLAANKVPGIRAAVCSEPYTAMLTRRHNNANIIAFGSCVVGEAVAEHIVDSFLNSRFEGGRHQRRIDMITLIERGENI